MREILFRGKRMDTGAWVSGDYYKQAEFYSTPDEAHFIITSLDALEYDLALEYAKVDPDTVGQYIGVKDRDGMRIFEGDILRGAMGDMVVFYGEIIGEGYGFQWKSASGGGTESMTGFIDEYEIIGNIHDNPELLEKEAAK